MLLLINVLLSVWVSWAHGQVKPCEFSEIKHGRLFWEDRYRRDFPVQVGQRYYYFCDDPYVTPSQNTLGRITCTPQGWSPEVPCIRKCVFNFLEHGHSPASQQTHLQGAFVRVSCHPGFSLPDQQSTMTCTESGWSPPPRCIRVDDSCGSPPTVENAFVQNQKARYRSGDTVRYECSRALDLFGNAEVTCLNGHWTEPPQCKDSKGECGPPPSIDNGDMTTFPSVVYAPGSSVEYQCQSFYELQGNRKITCRDGEWSEPPKCLEPCVISEEIMKKHNIQLRWSYEKKIYTRTNDVVQFTCRSGYRKASRQTAFRVRCREGVLAYPTCVK